MKPACAVVAISGPDGAGKTSVARRTAAILDRRGCQVATAYCYGCFACRAAPRRAAARPGGPVSRWHWLRVAHAATDAAELGARLTWARLVVRLRAHGRPAVVLTDRGPLDGLAKFDPPPRSPAAALFTWLSRRYDLTLLLDAPAQVLAARDGEHTAAELTAWRERYRRWGERLPVLRMDTAADRPAALAGRAARAAGALHRAQSPTTHRARPRVVISSFDSPGNPHYGGGGAAVVVRLARWLARDYQVCVVTAGCHGRPAGPAGVRYRYLPVGWAGPRGGQLLYHVLLPLTARRIPHDLWIESFTPPFSTSFMPLFARGPVVGLAQNLSGDEMSRRYRLPFFLIERFGLRFYHDIVVLNPADAERVRRYSPRATVTVIANCTDLRRSGAQQPCPGEHILFLGRIGVREKGLDLLLAAYRQAKLVMPLLLVGGGTQAEERKLVSLLRGAGEGVHWLGPAAGERKQDLLERCAFLVLPSRQEAFGLAALEAMAAGKPVIHFDLPTLAWMDGDVRVPPFDTGALVQALSVLATDRQQRQELGRAARAAALRYGPEQAAMHYLALVRRLIGGPGASDGGDEAR